MPIGNGAVLQLFQPAYHSSQQSQTAHTNMAVHTHIEMQTLHGLNCSERSRPTGQIYRSSTCILHGMCQLNGQATW